MRRVSLYAHVPFCKRRCPYCTFYHLPLEGGAQAGEFAKKLSREFEAAASSLLPFVIPTLYFGGGTPSLVGQTALECVLRAAGPHLEPTAEATIELNPEDVDEPLLDQLVGLGFNRVSLGIQTMGAREQKLLGRCAPEVNAAALELSKARFGNVSVDLLGGVPGRSLADLRRTLQAVCAFGPEHISFYCLEPGGDCEAECRDFFARVDAPQSADEYLEACAHLEAAGYVHYEVSNFAKVGRECAHNQVYWNGAEYLGIGPSAHSFIAGERFHNQPSVAAYLERSAEGIAKARVHDARGPEERRLEEVMLGLRTSKGVTLSGLEASHPSIAALSAEGLIRVSSGRLSLTDRGFLMLDEIVQRVLWVSPGREL